MTTKVTHGRFGSKAKSLSPKILAQHELLCRGQIHQHTLSKVSFRMMKGKRGRKEDMPINTSVVKDPGKVWITMVTLCGICSVRLGSCRVELNMYCASNDSDTRSHILVKELEESVFPSTACE